MKAGRPIWFESHLFRFCFLPPCYHYPDNSFGAGGFMQETVKVLKEYAKIGPECVKAFYALKDKETCFDWEEPLLQFIKK